MYVIEGTRMKLHFVGNEGSHAITYFRHSHYYMGQPTFYATFFTFVDNEVFWRTIYTDSIRNLTQKNCALNSLALIIINLEDILLKDCTCYSLRVAHAAIFMVAFVCLTCRETDNIAGL